MFDKIRAKWVDEATEEAVKSFLEQPVPMKQVIAISATLVVITALIATRQTVTTNIVVA